VSIDAPAWIAGRGFARGLCDSPEWSQHPLVVSGEKQLGPFPRRTRAEFLLGFQTPTTKQSAFTFGHRSGRAGHGRLSFAEFFANDNIGVRIVSDTTPSRQDLYHLYRVGHRKGKEARAAA
jgi:hypothetical protein